LRIFIITEGLKNTGYGHITRCLSLYQAFEEKGIQPVIIANCDDTGKNLAGNAKLSVYNWIEEKEKLLSTIAGGDVIVIDSYLAPKEYYTAISENTITPVYIDDYLRIDYPRGIIINGTIGAEKFPYKKNNDQIFLLGVDYIPIRKEFWDIETVPNQPEINILVIFGGYDSRNLTTSVLNELLNKYPSLIFNVVLGHSSNPDIENIKNKNLNIYHQLNASEMLKLMLNCQIAISAAGQTTYELARVGLKTIGVGVAENQKYIIRGWIETGFFKEEIWYNDENFLSKIKDSFVQFYENENKSKSTLCDGQGARRIVKKILKEISKKEDFYFSRASTKDMEKVFELSNRPDVRQNSINENEILWRDHIIWFEKKINDDNYDFYVAYFNDEFIAQIRFEINNDRALISISLDEKYRGKGLAPKIISKTSKEVFSNRNKVRQIFAYILPDNISSVKTFKNAGYHYAKQEILNNKKFDLYILKRKN